MALRTSVYLRIVRLVGPKALATLNLRISRVPKRRLKRRKVLKSTDGQYVWTILSQETALVVEVAVADVAAGVVVAIEVDAVVGAVGDEVGDEVVTEEDVEDVVVDAVEARGEAACLVPKARRSSSKSEPFHFFS
jgi:hypothetical protein